MRLADAEGLGAVSMRRVAADLGVATMTLYGHVPSKGALVDLMLDAVLGELHPDEQALTSGPWRARLRSVAHANRTFFLRHPWARQLAGDRAPLGPGRMRKYELELRTVDGLGLSDQQMHLLVAALDGFVRGTADDTPARSVGVGAAEVPADGGDAVSRPVLAAPVDPDRFPIATRVGVANSDQGSSPGDGTFEFGLERLLDGIGVLILEASR